MPFGLIGATFTFRRLVNLLPHNLKNVETYRDNLVVYSKTEQDHIRHLDAVLKRDEKFELHINMISQVAKNIVTVLEYKIGDGVTKSLPQKIPTINKITVPTSNRKLRQFMRRTTLYSRFVKNFIDIIARLHKLLGNEKCI